MSELSRSKMVVQKYDKSSTVLQKRRVRVRNEEALFSEPTSRNSDDLKQTQMIACGVFCEFDFANARIGLRLKRLFRRKMAGAWTPKNWEEVCKRNAGRRKLHMRKREERASRIVRILAVMDATPILREVCYGWLTIAAEKMGKSRATASRDFALCRRIHTQFVKMFGRDFTPSKDEIVWSWDWSHYGFRTPESRRARNRKPVGHFPFSTRDLVAGEEAYCGLTPLSWQDKFEEVSVSYEGGDFLSLMRSLKRIRI